MYLKTVFIVIFSIVSRTVESRCLLSYFKSETPNQEPRVCKPTPIVLWHGLGSNCCKKKDTKVIIEFLKKIVPGVYVHSVMIGKTPEEDEKHGLRMGAWRQVKHACAALRADPELVDGYNAIGLSQGGLLLRAVAQSCPRPRVLNLISIGGPQQGVNFLKEGKLYDYLLKMEHMFYWRVVQSTLSVPGYWHDPLKESKYRRLNGFLALLNNERQHDKYDLFKTNLLKLKNLVLVKFTRDTMLRPVESMWFGYYAPGQDKQVTPMIMTPLYVHDRIGLKTLHRSGRLHFLKVDGDHLEWTRSWIYDNILPFLKEDDEQ